MNKLLCRQHRSLKNYCLALLFPLSMLLIVKPALSSLPALIEVAEIMANIDHARNGIEKVNAIYDSTALASLIVQPNNNAYTPLENDFLSYQKKGEDWLTRFYQDKKIPKNLYIEEISPLEGQLTSAHFFAYIITNLNEETCNMFNQLIKPSVTYIYINQGNKINTELKRNGTCEDKRDNQIVILK